MRSAQLHPMVLVSGTQSPQLCRHQSAQSTLCPSTQPERHAFLKAPSAQQTSHMFDLKEHIYLARRQMLLAGLGIEVFALQVSNGL